MPKTLNKTPKGFLSFSHLHKVTAPKGTGGYPRIMRRAYAGVEKLNIPQSAIAAAYIAASPDRKKAFYADRIFAINAALRVISLNHDTVSGLVLLRSMTELAMRAGLATIDGIVVLVEDDYEQMNQLAGHDDSVNMQLYVSRQSVNMLNVSITRLTRAVDDLVGMGLLKKDEPERNYLTSRYMGTKLYVEPDFYLACGIPEEESRTEREMLMRKSAFLKTWECRRLPQSLTEARKLVADVARQRQYAYYRKKTDVAKNRRQLKKLASLDKAEIRHQVAQKLARTLSGEILVDRGEFTRLVEIETYNIIQGAENLPPESGQQGQFFPQLQ